MRNGTERSYLELVELAMSVVLRWDISGTVTFINEYGAELFGYQKKELVGRNIMGTIVDETESTGRNLRTIIKEIVTQPEKYRDNENENVTKDGKRLWMHWRNTAVLDSAGSLTEIISIGNDITGRKQAEEALKVSEARYLSILEDQTELICRYRHDGRISFVNGAYARYYGKQPGELLDRNYIPHIPEPDLSIVLDKVRKISFDEPIMQLTHRVIMTDGTIRWQHWTHRGIFTENGILIECQAVGRDITERKKIEQKLDTYQLHLEKMVEERTKNLEEAISSLTNEIDRRKEVEAALERNRLLLSGVFNSIQDGIAVVDRDQNIIMANRAVEKLFPNHSPVGFKIKKCFEVYRNATERCEDCATIRAIEGRVSQVETIPFNCAGSGEGWLEVYVFPFLGEEGEIKGVIQYLKDITERKRAEQHLALMNFALNNSHEAVFLTDENARFNYVNEESCRVLGYTRAELLGLGVPDIDPDFPAERWPDHWNDLKTQRSVVFEGRHRTKDGYAFPVEIKANHFDFDGRDYCLTLVRDITERKRAEEILRRSEEKYRTLFEESFDGLFISSPEGNILDINKKGIQILGYDTKEEVMSLDLERDIYACPPDRRRILSMVNDLGTAEYEVSIRRKRGETIVARCSLTAVQGDKGAITAYRGIIRDITEFKRVETAEMEAKRALQESEKRYRDLFQKAGEGILLLTVNGDIYSMNESFAAMHGYSIEEMLHMKLADLDIGLDPRVDAERKKKIVADGGLIFEVAHRHKAGHTIEFEVSVSFTELSGEKYFICFHRDISERKNAERELREKEGKLRAMIESFDGLIYICSQDYRIEFMNEKLIERTGRNAVGEVCYSTLHDRDSICPWCVNDRVFRGEIVRWELQSPKDGRWYYVVNTPIRHVDGSFSKQAMIMDITDKIKLEERARINDQLAVLGQLSAGITHEINNPNAFIMSNAQLLQDIWRDAEQVLLQQWRQVGDFSLGGLSFPAMKEDVQKAIRYLLEGSDRINNIVTSLKAYTSPLGDYVSENVDLNEVVRSSLEILDSQIKTATDNFRWIPDEEVPHVRGNRQALEQVVTNLITNALQALTDRTKGVSVYSRYERGPNVVIIEVTDEGVGMTQEILRRASNPFFTTKRDRSGVGLGLAIASSIVTNHNGSIVFESEAGAGTTVMVSLPCSYSSSAE
ncbi:MAG: PAS domain S-box protein [Nitrospirae bacterium]|nr:PAS domain S-box protein [Nitrospirota bacterium]